VRRRALLLTLVDDYTPLMLLALTPAMLSRQDTRYYVMRNV